MAGDYAPLAEFMRFIVPLTLRPSSELLWSLFSMPGPEMEELLYCPWIFKFRG